MEERVKMTFDKGDFIQSAKRTFVENQNLLQVQTDIQSFAGEPIGSFAQVRDQYRSADYDSKVLAGVQMNDEDDARTTLESLKSAETIAGDKMVAPESKPELF